MTVLRHKTLLFFQVTYHASTASDARLGTEVLHV